MTGRGATGTDMTGADVTELFIRAPKTGRPSSFTPACRTRSAWSAAWSP